METFKNNLAYEDYPKLVEAVWMTVQLSQRPYLRVSLPSALQVLRPIEVPVISPPIRGYVSSTVRPADFLSHTTLRYIYCSRQWKATEKRKIDWRTSSKAFICGSTSSGASSTEVVHHSATSQTNKPTVGSFNGTENYFLSSLDVLLFRLPLHWIDSYLSVNTNTPFASPQILNCYKASKSSHDLFPVVLQLVTIV